MKRIFTLCLVAASLSSWAQGGSQAPGSIKDGASGPALNKTLKKQPFKKATGTRATEEYWINYGEGMNIIYQNSQYNANYLFPDTVVRAEFGAGEFDNPWVHHLGQILDVTSDNLQLAYGIDWNTWTTYRVDSMGVGYAYTRVSHDSIVDTLMVHMYTNATAANLPTYYFTGMTDFGVDTLRFKAQKYTFGSNRPNATGLVTIKVPLTAADTAVSTFRNKFFSVDSFPVPMGKLLAVGITYKPGQAYSAADTLEHTLNSFNFGTFEEQGDASFPMFTNCPKNLQGCDWNVSSIVESDVRYNVDPGWNGFFIPTYAFTGPYAFEHHDIYYKVVSSNVGVNEAEGNNLVIHQNQPNPFSEITTIRYSLKDAGDVTCTVYDLTGKKVLEVIEAGKSAGTHALTIDGSSLNNGVYFYTVNAGGMKVTKKMSVVR